MWASDGAVAPGWAHARVENSDKPEYQADQTASVVTYLATLLRTRRDDVDDADGVPTTVAVRYRVSGTVYVSKFDLFSLDGDRALVTGAASGMGRLAARLLPGAGGGGFVFMIARSVEDARVIREQLTDRPPNRLARFFEFTVDPDGLATTVL